MKKNLHLRNQVLFSAHLLIKGDAHSFLKEMEVERIEHISAYSETAIIRASEEVLEKICADDRCLEIHPFCNRRLENLSEEILSQMDANGVTMSNQGSLVGMISAEREIFSLLSPQLEPYADRIQVLPYSPPPTVALHPSVVLSTLIGAEITVNGRRYRGIAEGTPTLFSTSETSIDLLNAVEDMLDGGVKIINFSAGVLNPEGYSELDRLLDRLIRESNLLFVTASGNRRVVSSPGIAYNVLTVGNLRTKRDAYTLLPPPWSTYCINAVNCSGYLADETTSHKPDVVAPGSFIPYITPSGNIFAENTGTSFACPYVTGTAVILKERFPTLSALELKLLIALSCDRESISDSFNPVIDGEQLIRLRTGCGLANLESALHFAQGGIVETLLTSGNDSYTVTLKRGQKLFAGICFYLNRDTDEYLNLLLDDIIICNRLRQNLHIIEYTAEKSETVNIKITGTPDIECARLIFTE
ncbi:MAG: S8/S53 family peptidase [Clostridia bacterium]|nr:S8/S53 family peptidase [Clostridia bacterium]